MTSKKELKKDSNAMDDFLENPLFVPQSIKRNKVIEGKIIAISSKGILVDLGSKSEGIISGKEIRSEKDFISQLKVGDPILASVIQVENDDGQVVLSLKRAGIERRWRILEEAFTNKKPVKVKVVDYNRGGLLVDCGVKGFIPISQLSQTLFPTSGTQEEIQGALEQLKGKEIEAYVLDVNHKSNKLILSARPLDQINFSFNNRASFLATIKVDEVKEGAITRIVPFGVLVDLGGIEGLVHISEVSWDRLKKPEDLYNVGDKIKVLVIEKNEEEGKVLLSIKRLEKDPWEMINGQFKEGQEVEGLVTKVTQFGAFVRIEQGIDGLVHNSRLIELNLDLKVNDKGLFKIVSMNIPLKRMSLEPVISRE